MTMNINDRRVQKTRKILHEALMALVLEKNYELISIREILDRANVGHSTFYTHYKDKDELLLRAFDGLAQELRVAQGMKSDLPPTAPERIIAFSQAMFAHAHPYRKIYLALIRSQAGPIVRQRIQKVVSDLIQEEANRQLTRKRKKDSDLPASLLVNYLASTLLSVLTWWAEQKEEYSPDSMNAMYRSLVMPVIRSNFN